jgi:hypothetical protein
MRLFCIQEHCGCCLAIRNIYRVRESPICSHLQDKPLPKLIRVAKAVEALADQAQAGQVPSRKEVHDGQDELV